ncbi:MAG: YbaN family protein, partial [Actinomycetota bacterium]|nr:YbaN family protein [Actinomycetota bacterium]
MWFAAGCLSVAAGAVGVIVPGLPTTVFFIAAAACFARCNPRFERWVLDLPR